jgi:hypothetical protein
MLRETGPAGLCRMPRGICAQEAKTDEAATRPHLALKIAYETADIGRRDLISHGGASMGCGGGAWSRGFGWPFHEEDEWKQRHEQTGQKKECIEVGKYRRLALYQSP